MKRVNSCFGQSDDCAEPVNHRNQTQ